MIYKLFTYFVLTLLAAMWIGGKMRERAERKAGEERRKKK